MIGGETEIKNIAQQNDDKTSNKNDENDVQQQSSPPPELDKKAQSMQLQSRQPVAKENEIVIDLDSDVEMKGE